MAKKERVSASGEPFWTPEERAKIKEMYPREQGYFPVFSRQSCELVPLELVEGAQGKAFHVHRDGSPAYESRWDYVHMFDPMSGLAWARRGDEAFEIDMKGEIVGGPITKKDKRWPFKFVMSAEM